MKERVSGIWRSYKVFYFSGKVDTHNDTTYLEILVDAQGAFTFLHSQDRRDATVFPPEQWRVELVKKRWYIYLGKRQAFEIITLEPEDMVLHDVVKGEKIFFAKLPEWHRRIEPAVNAIRHIKTDTKTKDR